MMTKTMNPYELNWGQRIILAVAGAILLSMTAGCGASYFACTTKASYDPRIGAFSYESCKDQQNFKAQIGRDETGNTLAKIETTATTPEAAIAAAMQSLAKLIDAVVPLIEKAVAVGSKGTAP